MASSWSSDSLSLGRPRYCLMRMRSSRPITRVGRPPMVTVSAERQAEGPQRRRQTFEVVGRAALTEVDVIRDARAAHEGLGLAAHDDELHVVLGQHGAEPFKRALLARTVQ